MLSKEEKEEIINKAIERALLALPEVIGQLMVNHAALFKINKAFYDKYPEYNQYLDLYTIDLHL